MIRLTLFFVFVCIALHCHAQQINSTASEVRFITTDIDRFWAAFDQFANDTTANPFIEYLQEGSIGLKDLARYSIRDSATFKQFIKEEFSYYENIRASTHRVFEVQKTVEQYCGEFKKLYPAAIIPDVYFVIGQLNSGGSASQHGVLIGAETFSHLSFKTSRGISSTPFDQLPLVVASCVMFFNQKPAHTGYTLLRQCIVHGGAEFLASLVLGDDKIKLLSRDHFVYGEQHEETLVREFLSRKSDTDLSGWLYGRPSPEQRPANLGFWIGYKITEAYFNNAPDKTKAIDEILKINDFEKFLLLSGYTEPFRN
jgi:hypothetical protein